MERICFETTKALSFVEQKLLENIITSAGGTCSVDGTRVGIEYDRETVERIRKRRAGRKVKDGGRLYRYSEIMEMRESMTADEIAGRIGVSRRTYFRRLKVLKEKGDADAFF